LLKNKKEGMGMALLRWDPFREMASLQERMNRIFSDSRVQLPLREEEIPQGVWAPPVDIYETADSIVLEAELPGITRDDIVVEVKDNTLTLKGDKKFEREVREENYHRVERSYGAFQRVFTLPSSVHQDRVKAKFKDGILEITLPKVEEAKPKQIKVEAS
jgi:HSP20 family protein